MRLNISFDPSDRDLVDFLVAFAAVEIFMLLFIGHRKVYDLATAAFFAACIGLMARGHLWKYLGMFALANFNRETSFLLAGVFLVYFFGQLPWRKYLVLAGSQVLLILAIRLIIVTIYADAPGVDMLVRPIENLQVFVGMPVFAIVHWAGFVTVIWLCARRWRNTPRILQVAILVMMSSLMLMYLILGYAFEIRVFAEVYPVVWAICCNLTVTS
jgi:hypothetical protein